MDDWKNYCKVVIVKTSFSFLQYGNKYKEYGFLNVDILKTITTITTIEQNKACWYIIL
jgi:hypothetical protein